LVAAGQAEPASPWIRWSEESDKTAVGARTPAPRSATWSPPFGWPSGWPARRSTQGSAHLAG